MRTSISISSRPPDALDDALLQKAQELDLQRQRKIADLVQEERAAIGRFDLADRLPRGPGEGSLFVAEQLALEQVFGNGGAVDGDETLAAPRRKVVHGPGKELFPRPALAQQQNGRGRSGDLFDDAADPLQLGVAREDPGKGVGLPRPCKRRFSLWRSCRRNARSIVSAKSSGSKGLAKKS
jgi:hypothetical protein